MKINEKTKGKGLALILGDLDYKAKELQKDSENTIQVDMANIVLNPYFEFSPDSRSVEKLANAIKENGQLTPILVRKKENYYELITGEKRYYACKSIGLDKIKVVVCDFSDQEVQELYMYDSFNKDRLNLVSEAKLYRNIIELKKINQSELAKRLGKSRSSISNSLRLLTLDKEVLDLVAKYKLTLGQVKPLIGLDTEIIIKLISRINSEKLSSREIELIARGEKNKNKKIIILNETERMLNQRYSCKSRVRGNKIELTFRNKKELEVFINSLK